MTTIRNTIITPLSAICDPRSAIRDPLGGRVPAGIQSLRCALTTGAASFRAAVVAAGVSALALLALAGGQARAQNLLTNPGFESDALGAKPATGWSNTAGCVGVTDSSAGIGIAPHEGTKEWMFQNSTPSLSQSVTIGAGNYSLSGWLASRPAGGYGFVSGNATFQLLDSGNNVITPSSSSSPDYNSPAGTWVNWTRTYTGLAAGTYTVKVSPGANNYNGYAQGMVDDFSLTQIVDTITTTTVGASANPVTAGASVTLTATVAPAGGTMVPAGSVQFRVDGVDVGSPVTVTAGSPSPNGTAALVTSALTVAGSHTVTALYTATSGFVSSSGSASLTVDPAAATALAFTTEPGAAFVDGAFGIQPVVKTRDAYGNQSTVGLAASKTVTIAIKTGTGTLSGTTAYDIGTDAGNGTITGSDLGIATAGGFTLSATAPDLTEGDSASFTVQAADANRLTNPGFEAVGSISPWSCTGGGLAVSPALEITAHGGVQQYQMQGANCTMTQSVALPAGNYSLSAWIASRNYLNFGLTTGDVTFQLLDSGNNVVSPSSSTSPDLNSPAGTYVQWTRTYLGLPAGNYTVKLNTGHGARPDINQGMVDDFSLAKVVTGTEVSTTTLAANTNTNPSAYGALLTFDVTVSGSPGTPSGAVKLHDGGPDGTLIGIGILSGGTCSFTTTTLALGSHDNIVAVYYGDPTYATSTSGALSPAQTVKGSSTVTVTGPTSFTYNGNPQGPDTAYKTGSSGDVTYQYEGVAPTTYDPSSTRPTAIGTYSCTATLAEDPNYFGAVSDPYAFEIVAAGGYASWGGSNAFDAPNSEGVAYGMAWILGAPTSSSSSVGLLPKPTTDVSGNLTLTFDCLSAAARGTAVLKVQYSKDLGQADFWTDHEAEVPGATGVDTTVNHVHFVTTANGDLIHVVATIAASQASTDGKLFGRLQAVGN